MGEDNTLVSNIAMSSSTITHHVLTSWHACFLYASHVTIQIACMHSGSPLDAVCICLVYIHYIFDAALILVCYHIARNCGGAKLWQIQGRRKQFKCVEAISSRNLGSQTVVVAI